MCVWVRACNACARVCVCGWDTSILKLWLNILVVILNIKFVAKLLTSLMHSGSGDGGGSGGGCGGGGCGGGGGGGFYVDLIMPLTVIQLLFHYLKHL